MTVWFTSDTHFRHKNIVSLGDGRPFKDIQHHDEMLIKNWNERVAPDDIVYHLGDVAMGPWPEGLKCLSRCAGRKFLIPGNHDRVSSVASKARRERFLPDYESVFEEILDEEVQLTLGGEFEVRASHYPYEGDSHDGDRFTKIRPKDFGRTLVHGHTHSREKISHSKHGSLQISVGVDAWGYAPVCQEQIINIIKRLTYSI